MARKSAIVRPSGSDTVASQSCVVRPPWASLASPGSTELMGRAGRMQVPGARTGLAHTLGGPGAVSCVAVLGQP